MKILTCLKSVADPAGSASTSSSGKIVNPFDEIGVEEALRLKEKGIATEVIAVTIGPAAVEEQLRSALAMGADRAIRVEDARQLDPYAVSRILKAIVLREKPSVVLMGKQAIDDDSNQAGQMLAGLLGWPQATFVSKLEMIESNARIRCTRETDAGLEVINVKLPAVITVDLRLNEPRYVSLPGLMKARRKPIEVLTLDSLGLDVRPRTMQVSTAAPAARPAGCKVGSVEELLSKLKDEAKVI